MVTCLTCAGLVLAAYEIASYERQRSHWSRGRWDWVKCACGHTQLVYTWSWAGHGKARCKMCKRWWLWAGGEQ